MNVSCGCVMQSNARCWAASVHYDTTTWEEFGLAVVSWNREFGVGSLLRYDMPRM